MCGNRGVEGCLALWSLRVRLQRGIPGPVPNRCGGRELSAKLMEVRVLESVPGNRDERKSSAFRLAPALLGDVVLLVIKLPRFSEQRHGVTLDSAAFKRHASARGIFFAALSDTLFAPNAPLNGVRMNRRPTLQRDLVRPQRPRCQEVISTTARKVW